MPEIQDERERIVRSFLPLVRTIARRIRRLVPSVDLDDLIGDGCVGLIRAVDAYDPVFGTTVAQYVRRIVLGTMLNGIRRMDPISERTRRTLRQAQRHRYALAVETGAMPSQAQMEQLVPGLRRAATDAYRGMPLSLDAALPECERVALDWEGDPARAVEERIERADARRLLRRVRPREARVLALHYFGERSLREIGEQMSVSPQRVSQLHLAALNRLRRMLDAPAG
ncbi:MAG: sigma-70 family RNA polymerase sigma factor [Vulcanimicrobiaceae bacterium]